ncbi:MAG: 4'-phosphopantetheinyl transferase superfamily protein [Bacteroidales bacterium]
MALFEIRTDGEALTGIWHIEENEQQLLDLLYDPSLYEEQLAVLTNEKRRLEFLAVRVLLRELTGGQKCVGYEPSGKPFLTDHSFQISISHTHGYAAVMIHPTQPVAIDIERRADRVMRLRSKFLNRREEEGTDSASPLLYTLICWSAKETLFKIMNCQQVDFKDHLLLTPFQVADSGSIEAYETRSGYAQADRIAYEVQRDYVLTSCIR